MHSASGVAPVVAGRGRTAGRTRRPGGGQPELRDRVDLLGFVPDDELVELFADALAVVYAPRRGLRLRHPAGLPGRQAGDHRRDSGGVLEWVEDGVTGFVTDGSPESFGKAADRLAEDPELAQRMGEAGRARIQGWSWSEVVATLLER